MAHLYKITVLPSDNMGFVLSHLIELKLIKNPGNVTEESVTVEVSNKQKFLAWHNMKDDRREASDPHLNSFISVSYMGEQGKAAPSGKEGKLAATRKRNAQGKRVERMHHVHPPFRMNS